MIARVLLFAALALPAAGGIRVTLVDRYDEVGIGPVLTLPAVEAGSVLQLRFRARAGVQPERVEVFDVEGADFVTTRPAMTPVVLAPGAYLDVLSEFRPALAGGASATLRINDQRITILAQVMPAPFVRLADGTPLRTSEAVNFGQVELGSAVLRKFAIENPTSQTAVVQRLDIVGSGFAGNVPATPFEIAPGTSHGFEVTFEPNEEGHYGATLSVNSRQFSLEGTAVMPVVSRPRIIADSGATRSGQQAKIAVKLESPAKWPVDGVLRMSFSGPSDPAVRLLSGDGRALAFRIAAGEDTARFGSAAAADFQTGTSAGRVTFTVELQSWREELVLDVAAAPVEIDSVTATRAANSVEVELHAFDNTRTASELAFTFQDRKGRTIGKGAIRVDAAQDFRRYFDAASLGGMFSLRAVFPVRGSVTEIGSVDVEVVNSQGTGRRSVTISQ